MTASELAREIACTKLCGTAKCYNAAYNWKDCDCGVCADFSKAIVPLLVKARADGIEAAAKFVTPGRAQITGGPFTNEQVEELFIHAMRELAGNIRALKEKA